MTRVNTPTTDRGARKEALVVTDRPESCASLESLLEERGLRPRRLSSADVPRTPAGEPGAPSFVDVSCGRASFQELLTRGHHVVAVAAGSRREDILEAMRMGARDFLTLPPAPNDLDGCLDRAAGLEARRRTWLEFRDRHGNERQLSLTAGKVVLGRDPASDVVFDSPVVSRFHAEIRGSEERCLVVDLGSRHGTWVNGNRTETRELANDDLIRLGGPGAPTIVYRRRTPAPEPTSGSAATPSVEDSSREIKDIASLLDTFLTLKTDLVLDDLLEIVVRRSIELADADRGMILLGDAEPGVAADPDAARQPPGPTDLEVPLRIAIARNKDGTPIIEKGLLISRRIPSAVLRTGKGEIFEDLLAPDAADDHPGTIEIGVRSAMCVPLRTRRAETGPDGLPQVLGVLYVDSALRKRPFSPRQLQAFESLASEASQAIFNARLYKVCLEKRRMDEEVRIAQLIQQNFLPPADFVGGWVALHGTSSPSREVGGDFLHYYPVSDDHIGLAVGDVSGKGIPAAILSAMLDGLCFGLAAEPAGIPELDRVASTMNRYLVVKSSQQKFVSFFLGLLFRDGSLRYVNAGHNPPIRVRPDGTSELLRTGGLILGVLEDAEYRPEETRLEPGDLIVLYSDGITEARRAGGDRFGVDRLRASLASASALPPAEVHRSVLARLDEFLAGADPEDDVTLLVARYGAALDVDGRSSPSGAVVTPPAGC